MKKWIRYVACLLVLLQAGCDRTVLEFPEGEGVDPTLVNLNLKFMIDTKIEPYVPVRSDAIREDAHDVRWIIEVFRNKLEGNPVERWVLGGEQALDGQHTISTSIALHAARYYVVAWMEYVDNGSIADKYYKVNSLASITIPEVGTYIGNEDHKDTYVAQQEIDLTNYRDRWNETVERTVMLKRPMAKIEFITTDIDKFLDKLNTRGLKGGSLVPNESTMRQDLSTFQVQVEYSGYFPSGFNAYTNKPNDSRTGISFTTRMTQLSAQEAYLANDYIFVNGTESVVIVNLIIRDGEGNLLNEVGGIKVPIVRGKLTTICDEFLTHDYTPGIGINPDFDGEISVIIPD